MHHDIYGTGHHAADGDNKLLAAIYSALIDRFEIDVCLTGHEHLYGRSFFMKDTKPVKDQKYNADGAVVDPVGTVYFTASSASGKNRIEDYDYEWLDLNMSPKSRAIRQLSSQRIRSHSRHTALTARSR